MKARGISLVVAISTIMIALATYYPDRSIASTSPVDTGTGSGSNTSGGTGSLQVPFICNISKTSQLNSANEQCPADTGKYSYACDYPKIEFINGTEVQCERGRSCSELGGSSGIVIKGTCQCPSVCEANGTTQVAGANGAPAGTGSQSQQPPTVTPDKPPTTGNSGGQAASGGTQSSVPPTSSPAPTNGGANSSSGTGAGSATNGSGSGAGPTPPASPPANSSSGSVFSGTPGLNTIGSQPTTGPAPTQGPTSGYPAGGSYTPTTPTFPGIGRPSSSPTLSASSPLTTFFSSFAGASLTSIFGYLTSFFAPTDTTVIEPPSSAPTDQQVAVQVNPVVTTASGDVSPQLTQDTFTPPATSQNFQWDESSYSSLLALLNGGQTVSPAQLVTIINSQEPPQQLPVITNGAMRPDLSLLGEQLQQFLGINSTSSGQAPEVASSALDTTKGVQGYRNIPEQFYVEEASLAQAQSNYEWLQSQIDAWENAQQAGACDTSCTNALAILQTEVPSQLQRVRQFQALVAAGPDSIQASSSTSTVSQILTPTVQVPGAGQSSVVMSQHSVLQTLVPAEGAPYYTKQDNQWCDQYGQCIPASSFATSPAVPSVSAMADFSTSNPSPGSPVDPVTEILQAVKGWVNDVLAVFTPGATSSNASVQTCSLFKSLFGGCSSGW